MNDRYSVFLDGHFIASFYEYLEVMELILVLVKGARENAVIEVEKVSTEFYVCYYVVDQGISRFPSEVVI